MFLAWPCSSYWATGLITFCCVCVFVCAVFLADQTSSIWRDESSSDLTAPLCPPYAQTRLCVTLQTMCVTVCPLALCSSGMSVCAYFVYSLLLHISGVYTLRVYMYLKRMCMWNIFVTLQGVLSLILMCAPKPLPSALCRSATSCSEPPIVVPLVRQTAHNRHCLTIHSTTEHY